MKFLSNYFNLQVYDSGTSLRRSTAPKTKFPQTLLSMREHKTQFIIYLKIATVYSYSTQTAPLSADLTQFSIQRIPSIPA